MSVSNQIQDLWQRLATSTRPLVVYGMGNGADKLFDRLHDMGRTVSAVVASDGFVRGQSFRGHRVMTLTDAHTAFPDAILLIAFGTRLTSVLTSLEELRGAWELYVPDMPVCDGAFFDASFRQAHADALAAARRRLSDAPSRALFDALVDYKLTGEWDALMSHTTDGEDIYRLIGAQIGCAVDLGAYRGDTAAQMMRHFPHLTHLIAVEPDARSYKKLQAFAEQTPSPRIEPHRAAVSDHDAQGVFYGAGNRNSSLCATSHAYREEHIPLLTVDALCNDRTVDYIKFDVEGAEWDALRGAAETIARCRPILRVAAYHRSEDLYRLPLLLDELCSEYDMYLRRMPCIPAWEADLICIPKERSLCHDLTS